MRGDGVFQISSEKFKEMKKEEKEKICQDLTTDYQASQLCIQEDGLPEDLLREFAESAHKRVNERHSDNLDLVRNEYQRLAREEFVNRIHISYNAIVRNVIHNTRCDKMMSATILIPLLGSGVSNQH